jgi:hypothetical protein
MESPFGFGIVSINWTLDGNNVNLSSVKYDGNILGTHTLKIYDFQSGDSGRYRCIAANAMGTGQSEEIELQMIGKSKQKKKKYMYLLSIANTYFSEE